MNTRISAAVIVSASLFGAACGQQPIEVVVGGEPENTSVATTAEPGSRPSSTLDEKSPADTKSEGATIDRTAEVPEIQPGDSVAMPDPTPDPSWEIPGDDDWTEHELARLVLTSDELGDGWEIDYIDVIDPEPADRDNKICGVAEPAQLDGLEIEMSSQDGELVQAIGQGTEAEAQSWLTTFEALVACDGSEESDFMTSSIFSPNVAGADDTIGAYFEVSDSADVRFVGARFGNVFVFVGSSAASAELLQSVEWLEAQVAWSGAQL